MEEFIRDLTKFYICVGKLDELYNEYYRYRGKEEKVNNYKLTLDYLVKKYNIKFNDELYDDDELISCIEDEIGHIEDKFREILFENRFIGNITEKSMVNLYYKR